MALEYAYQMKKENVAVDFIEEESSQFQKLSLTDQETDILADDQSNWFQKLKLSFTDSPIHNKKQTNNLAGDGKTHSPKGASFAPHYDPASRCLCRRGETRLTPSSYSTVFLVDINKRYVPDKCHYSPTSPFVSATYVGLPRSPGRA